jgi:type I restriction-modification system DNA methylase subunit
LALHGLSGDIRLANSYYEDPHHAIGAFDFVMANPPFNVNGVDKARVAGDPRLSAVPRPDNANYLWFSSSTRRSAIEAAPDSLWPTRPATRGTLNAR